MKHQSLRGVLAIGAAAIFLVSCHTIPLRNQPLEHYEATGGYRYENIAPGPNNSDSMLVILTFSGGGTRAAAFCYGVLEALRDTEIEWEGTQRRLLDEVDIISSVSGGSLPAAYYALFGDRIFEDFPEKALYRDIQGNLVKQVLSLSRWSKLASPFYGRTDIMADSFSHDIFEGATFADLEARNQRPFVVLNATDVSLGSRFDFTQRQFDLLYSDLSEYPVGHAVAASAAFPGLLTPMTLRNYEKPADYVPPTWIQEELDHNDVDRYRYRQAKEAETYIGGKRPYVHVSDGGVSDNLGLLPVLQLVGGQFPGDDARSQLMDGTVKKVVIITVNAKRVNAVNWDSQASVLSVFKVLGVASSTPLGNFSEAELALMHQYLKNTADKQALRKQLAQMVGDDRVIQEFPLLAGPEFDCHFVEIEFDRLADEDERAYLNSVPTAFKLEREQVDRLRAAARTIVGESETLKNALDTPD